MECRLTARVLTACGIAILSPFAMTSCASTKANSAEQFDVALKESIAAAQVLSDQGKLPTLRGFVAEIYLGLQRRYPDLPEPMHAYYRAMMEGAPMVDAGKMSTHELLTVADLAYEQSAREWRAKADAANRARWSAALAGFAKGYKAQADRTIRCRTQTIGTYTYTDCN